jgi:hypothetical protein
VDHQRLAEPLRVVVLHEAQENQRTNFVLCQRKANFCVVLHTFTEGGKPEIV